MNKQRLILIFLIFLLISTLYGADEDLLSIELTPGIHIPLFETADYFTYGPTGDLTVEFKLPFLPRLCLRGEAGYEYLPIVTQDGLHVLSAGAGVGVNFPIAGFMTMTLYGTGGYYYGMFSDQYADPGGGLAAKGGLDLSFRILPSISLGVDVNYQYKHSLYDGIGTTIGLTYTPRKVEAIINEIFIDDIFPAFYKYYDTHPIGKAILLNKGTTPVEDIEIYLYIDRYMDNPKICKVQGKLDRGKSTEVELYALFNNEIFSITEGTKVSGKISLSYTIERKAYKKEFSSSIRINNRNAMTWDDDRKAAAFITAKDPVILRFAKNVLSWTKEKHVNALDKNLQLAFGIHEALRVYGINYSIDPVTSYEEFSKNVKAVDYLQFPGQTLTYSAGDCDDLSILYCAMLEAIGIETAFVTVPGHIYIAFALKQDKKKALKAMENSEDLIIRDDQVWIPLEITMVNTGFFEAWRTGAVEWKKYEGTDQARFYPTHESWKTYEPVGSLRDETQLTQLVKNEIVDAYTKEIDKYIRIQISSQENDLTTKMKQGNKKERYQNKLGILYASYGMVEEAKALFEQILEKASNYIPALVNFGNLYYQQKMYEEAIVYYKKVIKENPDLGALIIQYIRCNWALGYYAEAQKAYDRLKATNPELAAEHNYLAERDSSSRAAETDEDILWMDDE